MGESNLTCRLRVKKLADKDDEKGHSQETAILPLKDCPDIDTETRLHWASEVMEHFGETSGSHTSIRSWDFIAAMDGSVESLPVPEVEDGLTDGYPTRFQIPPTFIDGVDNGEKVRRAEKFAMASLLYEIMTGRMPLEEVPDNEVRHRFINGDFPEDVVSLPNVLFILSGWSAAFSEELTRRGRPHSKITLFRRDSDRP